MDVRFLKTFRAVCVYKFTSAATGKGLASDILGTTKLLHDQHAIERTVRSVWIALRKSNYTTPTERRQARHIRKTVHGSYAHRKKGKWAFLHFIFK